MNRFSLIFLLFCEIFFSSFSEVSANQDTQGIPTSSVICFVTIIADQGAIWKVFVSPTFKKNFNIYFAFPQNSTLHSSLQQLSAQEFSKKHKIFLERPWFWFDKKVQDNMKKTSIGGIDGKTKLEHRAMKEEDVITLLKPGQFVLTKVSLVNQDRENAVVSDLKNAFGPGVDEAFRLTLNLKNSPFYTFSGRVRIIIKKRGFPFMQKVALSPYIQMNMENYGGEWQEVVSRFQNRHKEFMKLVKKPKVSLDELPPVVKFKSISYSGHGNRFPGFACGLLTAMLSDDRILMIEDSGPQHIDFKLPGSNWREYGNLYDGEDRVQKLERKWFFDGDFNALVGRDVKILEYQTDDYDCALLQVNENYAQTLKRWFPRGNMFHHLNDIITMPSKKVEETVSNFVSKNFSNYTIGIHYRTQKKIPNNIVPSRPFCELATSLALRQLPNTAYTTVFIATDSNEARMEIADCLEINGLRPIFYEHDMNKKSSADNPGDDFGALVDLYTLSRCSDMIITFSSSFGGLAAGIGDVSPYYIMPETDLRDSKSASFWGGVSSEPCMYQSRTYAFDERTKDRFRTHPNYLQMTQCHFPTF
jgi:hypothetical protein